MASNIAVQANHGMRLGVALRAAGPMVRSYVPSPLLSILKADNEDLKAMEEQFDNLLQQRRARDSPIKSSLS